MFSQHSRAEPQVLNHFVLQSFGLEPERIPKRACTSPKQIELAAPIEAIPLGEQLFAMAQLSLPLLLPTGAQAARDNHADGADQPEPEAKSSCRFRIGHPLYSCRSVTIGSTFVARRAGR